MSEHDTNEIENNEIQEQYRMMAQMEAAMRVKDNTGFDSVEYKRQRRLLEEQRAQEEKEATMPWYTKPTPRLPQAKTAGGGENGSSGSRAQEPPLPFTRANRRFGKNSRNRDGRVRVPDLCLGVVVAVHKNGSVEEGSSCRESNGNSDTVATTCWGCDRVLRVHVLSTLVQCPECWTVGPVT